MSVTRTMIGGVVLAAGLATAGVGAASADNGVGPSPGTTGNDRACHVHAESHGQSKGNGLHCAWLKQTVGPAQNGVCPLAGTGRGLLPGSGLGYIISYPDGHHDHYIVHAPLVAPDGTWSDAGSLGLGESIVTGGTAADGSPVTSNTVTCT
jgi:hypothetical protein